MSCKVCGGRNFGRLFLTLGTLVFFTALMLQPVTVSESVAAGMAVFTGKLVPVLFPYMVLSHFFCTYSLLDPLAALLPVGKLFRMNSFACGIFLIGHLCGYPVGAKMAAESVRQGKLSRRQGEILCAVSSGASPAFLIHAVGGGLWGDPFLGIFLLAVQILFGVVSGTVLGRREQGSDATETVLREDIPFARCFCEAVGGSAVQLVSIGGYIVFFTLFTALLPFRGICGGLAAALLEFSAGVRMAAETGGMRGLFLTGFAVGFGGLSVLAQTAHMVSGSGISVRTYVLTKIVSGFIMGSAALLYGFLRPDFPLRQITAAGIAVPVSVTDPVWFIGLLGMMWYFSLRHGGMGR